MTLLKSKDLHVHADLSTLAAEQAHVDEVEAAFLFERNISSDIYFLARNLSRPVRIWQAFSNHFPSTS